MNHFRSIRPLLAVAAGGLLLAACSTAPTPEPLIHTPGVGSGYNFTNLTKDSTGKVDPSSETHTTRTIIATNATVAGQTGVVQFLEGTDTTNMHYKENGDVMFLQPEVDYPSAQFPAVPGVPVPSLKVPARWVTIPFGSKTTTTIPEYDTNVSITVSGFPLTLNIKASGTGAALADENFSVGSESLPTNKGLVTVKVDISAGILFSGSFTTVDSVWFSRKLGMFVKDDATTSSQLPPTFGTSGVVGGSVDFLTSYTLK